MTAQPTATELHDVQTELASVRLQQQASRLARDAAERARDRAELARDAAEEFGERAQREAEEFGESARREIESLREQVAFFQEQAWSTRVYLQEVIQPTLDRLVAERPALQAECAALQQAMALAIRRREPPELGRPTLRLVESDDRSWGETVRSVHRR
jgi:hypothetical protein